MTSSDVQETTIHIYWDPPEFHEMFFVKSYYINYQKTGEKKWRKVRVDSNQVTNGGLRNLERNSIYTIYITATNDEGMSKNSESITEKTLKENGNKIINITLYNTMCCI